MKDWFIIFFKLSTVQNFSRSFILEPFIPSINALVAPALVPINKSKDSKILFDDSSSSFLKK